MTKDRITENYRNFFLVAALHKGRFRGRAFKAEQPQFDVEGSSIADVVDQLHRRVDQVLADLVARRETQPVSSKELVAAFKSIEKRLSDGQRAMLKAHVHAPDRTLTATELAAAAGYENYSAANLQYGFVGKWLYEELLCPLLKQEDGTNIYTSALASGLDDGKAEDQLRWVMKPEVAAALEELGLSQ